MACLACLHAVLHYSTAEDVVEELHVCIGASEEGVVSLYNEEVGMWEYNLSGVGVRPGMMDPTRITATLGSDGTSFVSWRNPFVDPVKVSLTDAFAAHYLLLLSLPSSLHLAACGFTATYLWLGLCLCRCVCAFGFTGLVFVSAFVFAVACLRLCWHLLVALPLPLSLHLPAVMFAFTN